MLLVLLLLCPGSFNLGGDEQANHHETTQHEANRTWLRSGCGCKTRGSFGTWISAATDGDSSGPVTGGVRHDNQFGGITPNVREKEAYSIIEPVNKRRTSARSENIANIVVASVA